MRTYQHSGIVPALGAIQALAIGTATAIVLGIVYCFTFYYIPYVYLNFLLALGFGAGVGGTAGWAAREGKIRNTGAAVAIAVFASLLGIYAEWGSTVFAMAPIAELNDTWKEIGLASFLPHKIIGVMILLFEEGSWGLGVGAMVNGWTLFGLWIIEAGMIIGLAATTAYSQLANRPFCEPCSEWITGETPHFYVGDGSERVWIDVQHGEFDGLADTSQATGSEPAYVRIKLHVCDTCTESNYLTITKCENTTDHKGNPRLVENDIITNLGVDSTQVDFIRTAHMIAPVPGMPPLPLEPTAGQPIPAGAGAAATAPGANWTTQS